MLKHWSQDEQSYWEHTGSRRCQTPLGSSGDHVSVLEKDTYFIYYTVVSSSIQPSGRGILTHQVDGIYLYAL